MLFFHGRKLCGSWDGEKEGYSLEAWSSCYFLGCGWREMEEMFKIRMSRLSICGGGSSF